MAASPYYAPTYFPPSFFYIAVEPGTTVLTQNGSPYYAPTYFPPSYFYEGVSSSSSVNVTTNPTRSGRDQASYAALIGLIEGLGLFEEVIFGSSIQRNQAGADCYPLAVLTPKGWEESDDYDPTSVVRRTIFGITIVVQSQQGEPRFDELDELSSAILGAVDFANLGPLSLPGLTRIRAGRYEPSTHYPEQSVELEGEFSSLIESQSLVSASN
jgi:hypothetical protein